MHLVLRSISFFLAVLLLHACGKSGSGTETPAPSGDDAPSAGGGDTGPSGTVSIPLTEKRFLAYVAYRKELHGLYRAFAEDMAKFAKTVDAKSGGAEQMATAVQGMRIPEKHDALIKTLRRKHGFGEDEDQRLWDAMNEVASAKIIDPATEPSLEIYRKMQEKGGEEKKIADEFFASLEASEKEGMQRVRERCGDECVEVLAKHVKEIRELQLDVAQQMMAPHAAVK